MVFPMLNQTSRYNQRGLATLFGGHVAEEEKPAIIHHGMIGRGHVGKTALFRVLQRFALQYELPSRLQFDMQDPTILTGAMQRYQATARAMHEDGLAQTVDAESVEFRLFEGDAERLVIHSAEVIGQILTHTTADSPPEQKAKYAKYLSHLAQTDVKWVVIPTPPRDSRPADMERYENDLIITRTYLREALRLRRTERPCSVAIVLTKLDSLFGDEEEARSQLTDRGLIEALHQLITMMESTPKVANAIVCPVSAFGFGNAVVKDAGEEARNGVNVLEAGELEWILKEGVVPEPFNLAPLVLWTMLCGLLHQEVDEDESTQPMIARICQMLAEDLEAVGGWYVPVKGPLSHRV
jgi:hypothetical protein